MFSSTWMQIIETFEKVDLKLVHLGQNFWSTLDWCRLVQLRFPFDCSVHRLGRRLRAKALLKHLADYFIISLTFSEYNSRHGFILKSIICLHTTNVITCSQVRPCPLWRFCEETFLWAGRGKPWRSADLVFYLRCFFTFHRI